MNTTWKVVIVVIAAIVLLQLPALRGWITPAPTCNTATEVCDFGDPGLDAR